MSKDDIDGSPSGEAKRAAKRKIRLVLSAFLGFVFALVVISVVTLLLNRNPLPELTQASMDDALRRWEENSPLDYDLEVSVQGPQASVYRVEVRGGNVQSAMRNGAPLLQQRTFTTWSVPGMFGTIQRDLDNVQRVSEGKADALTPLLNLRVSFHPELGYPQQYQRIQWGAQQDVTWEVVEYRPRPKK